MRTNLLETVQRLLQRTYGMEADVGSVGRFVIGDRGFRLLYERSRAHRSVEAAEGQGARTLVRETAAGVRASIYFPDEMIRALERHPPQHGLGDRNVDAFAVLVEEVDHLLCIAERVRQARPVSLFELELHANVSKYLVLARFLAAGRPGLGPRRRLWLDYHLFRKHRCRETDASVRARYEDAGRLARRFVRGFRSAPRRGRQDLLRRFHHAGVPGKLEIIEELDV